MAKSVKEAWDEYQEICARDGWFSDEAKKASTRYRRALTASKKKKLAGTPGPKSLSDMFRF